MPHPVLHHHCNLPLQEAFPAFFQAVLGLKSGEAAARMRMHERVAYIVFAINAFQVRTATGRCSWVNALLAVHPDVCLDVLQRSLHYTACRWLSASPLTLALVLPPIQSLEDEAVRAQVLRLVSLPLWHALSRGRLQLELHDQPQVCWWVV